MKDFRFSKRVITGHTIHLTTSFKNNPICPLHNKRAIICEPPDEIGCRRWFCIDCVAIAIYERKKTQFRLTDEELKIQMTNTIENIEQEISLLRAKQLEFRRGFVWGIRWAAHRLGFDDISKKALQVLNQITKRYRLILAERRSKNTLTSAKKKPTTSIIATAKPTHTKIPTRTSMMKESNNS